MPQPNQIERQRDDVEITEAELIAVPEGEITEAGLRHNVNVAICYIESWLRGNGCVALNNLMEDAATAEISRTQVWHWIHHRAQMADGRSVDIELVRTVTNEELDAIRATVGAEQFATGRYHNASGLLLSLVEAETLEEFLTLRAYEKVVTLETA